MRVQTKTVSGPDAYVAGPSPNDSITIVMDDLVSIEKVISVHLSVGAAPLDDSISVHAEAYKLEKALYREGQPDTFEGTPDGPESNVVKVRAAETRGPSEGIRELSLSEGPADDRLEDVDITVTAMGY
jgi:hypothetical protein